MSLRLQVLGFSCCCYLLLTSPLHSLRRSSNMRVSEFAANTIRSVLLDLHLTAATLKALRSEVNDMDCPTTVSVVVDNPGSLCSCGWYLTRKHNDSDMTVVPQWDRVACHALKTTQRWHEWDLKHWGLSRPPNSTDPSLIRYARGSPVPGGPTLQPTGF